MALFSAAVLLSPGEILDISFMKLKFFVFQVFNNTKHHRKPNNTISKQRKTKKKINKTKQVWIGQTKK